MHWLKHKDGENRVFLKLSVLRPNLQLISIMIKLLVEGRKSCGISRGKERIWRHFGGKTGFFQNKEQVNHE